MSTGPLYKGIWDCIRSAGAEGALWSELTEAFREVLWIIGFVPGIGRAWVESDRQKGHCYRAQERGRFVSLLPLSFWGAFFL